MSWERAKVKGKTHIAPMKRIRLAWELKLFAAGYGRIAGVDEVGRGAWAGPLVAAAVLMEPFEISACRPLTRWVRDSKALSVKQREQTFGALIHRLRWAIGVVTREELDTLGMTVSNGLVLERAIAALAEPPDFVLVDGRGFRLAFPHQQVIHGDQKIFCVAAASIIAKVTRDRWMEHLDREYPGYAFGRHKGYGTAAHQAALARFGPCPIHRRSFAPISAAIGECRVGHQAFRASQEVTAHLPAR